ncbi:MAG: XTP/dITP diphosphatase [Calditrichaeota bacterium]|nr:XTP/dITP diphosphatase [Calditrichota bacterium]
MTIVLATKNKDKIREIKKILSDLSIELKTMADFPDMPDVEEDGATLEENALKKAVEFHNFTGLPALADDTGLEVDALSGAPGVYSSRFAGEEASYADNRKKLLEELKGVPEEKRGAQFRCVVAFVDGSYQMTTEGIVRGKILTEERGNGGFGYDPVFWLPEFEKTFAEMDLDKKNGISHRGIAFRKMKAKLEAYLSRRP